MIILLLGERDIHYSLVKLDRYSHSLNLRNTIVHFFLYGEVKAVRISRRARLLSSLLLALLIHSHRLPSADALDYLSDTLDSFLLNLRTSAADPLSKTMVDS